MKMFPEDVREILKTLETAGFQGWCVGGCVRDLLLGRTPQDWDATTDALPEEMLSLFAGRAVPTGLPHGTITVRTAQRAVEITTFRCDGAYRDHRRPEQVTFTTSLEQDLLRRDFTVNAMAMNLQGDFCDVSGGREDLERGVLRCVGDPERRFREDALRMMRGLRFSAVLGFSIQPETAAAIHENRALLREIASERIWTELSKLLPGRDAARILRAYPDVFGAFWPELLSMVGFQQKNPHHCYDLWEHTLHAVEAAPPDLILRCAMLLHDAGKAKTFTLDERGVGHFYAHAARSGDLADAMLGRVRAPTAVRETVVRLVKYHDRPFPATAPGVRKALRQFGEQDFRRLLAVQRADCAALAPPFRARQSELDQVERLLDGLLAEETCFSLKQLAVNGKHLTQIGYRGPAVGAMLAELLDDVVNEKRPNDRDTLLAYARRAYAAKTDKTGDTGEK